MTRHAKNSCSGAVFTYHERSKLEYGTKSGRLSSDSMKRWDSCSLCLKSAIEPMIWYSFPDNCEFLIGGSNSGHLFCKECILNTILSLKQELKRKHKLAKKEAEEKGLPAPAAEEDVKCPEGDHKLRVKELTHVKLSPNEVLAYSLSPQWY